MRSLCGTRESKLLALIVKGCGVVVCAVQAFLFLLLLLRWILLGALHRLDFVGGKIHELLLLLLWLLVRCCHHGSGEGRGKGSIHELHVYYTTRLIFIAYYLRFWRCCAFIMTAVVASIAGESVHGGVGVLRLG